MRKTKEQTLISVTVSKNVFMCVEVDEIKAMIVDVRYKKCHSATTIITFDTHKVLKGRVAPIAPTYDNVQSPLDIYACG